MAETELNTDCDVLLQELRDRDSVGHSHGHSHDHDHDHSHGGHVTWRLAVMIGLNFIVFVAELVTGFLTKSLSMQSDAWHMLSDEAGLIVGLVAHRLSSRPPTEKMTFGWQRMEPLGGLVNATFLLAICLTILFDAIERFADPPEIERPLLFIIVGAIGLVTNVIGMLMFHDHGHSDNIRGVFLHIFGDFLGSIGVMITAIVYQFSSWHYKMYLDPIFSVIIVAMLVYGSVSLFKKTAQQVLERCPDGVDVPELQNALLAIEGILSVHELHVWELSKKCLVAMIHLVVEDPSMNRRVQCGVNNKLIARGIFSSTVQVEFLSDFPLGVESSETDTCALASSVGRAHRIFRTRAAYRHAVGCPHVNKGDDTTSESHVHSHSHGGEEVMGLEDADEDGDDHDHDHDHDHGHEHGHGHDHGDHDHHHGGHKHGGSHAGHKHGGHEGEKDVEESAATREAALERALVGKPRGKVML